MTEPINHTIVYIRNKFVDWIDKGNGWADVIYSDLSTTIVVSAATLPIIMITFKRVSIVSPLVNMIVLWMVPPMMVLGRVLAMTGFLSDFMSSVVSWVLWPLLRGFVGVVEVFSRLSFADVKVEGVPWFFGIGWWMLLFAWWKMAVDD